jgi:hypothetical protein
MKKIACLCIFPLCFVLIGARLGQDKIETKTIDGVVHVRNPAKPPKGVVTLELEKILEIDPYKFPDVGARIIYAARADDGTVVLYDPNSAEAHRFSAKGEYLGRLFQKGQGPGEFASGTLIWFRDDSFLVASFGKVAKYDKSGKFLEEKRIEKFPSLFVNDEFYFTEQRTREIRKILLIHSPKNGRASLPPILFFEAQETWLHRANDGSNRGFSSIWTTPIILQCYDPQIRRSYVTMNTSISIQVRDLEGKTLRVIEKPHKKIKLSRQEKEKVTFYKGPADNWKIDNCPDYLVALREIETMPGGHLAAFRFSSFEKTEIDIFDSQGRFIYTLALPEKIELRNPFFHRTGMAGVLYGEDSTVYVEYRIKNLPEIFR